MGCINYFNTSAPFPPSKPFCLLYHVDGVWHADLNWPFKRNETVKDHSSISSGLEGFSVPWGNAESSTRQRERLKWEVEAKEKHVDVHSGQGI